MNKLWPRLIAGLVVLALVAGAYFGWRHYQARQIVAAPPAVVAEPPAPPVQASAPAEPAIRHPLADAASEPPAGSGDAIADGLAGLLGGDALARFFNLDDFARRFVATVDNLPREQAAASLWPVQPTPGRFAPGGAGELSAVNAERYTPFVRLVGTVDAAQAAALYKRLYPRFQQAYEELGYPRRYFNDRLVETIDHLLATPEPAVPPRLTLTEVKGPLQPARPWLRYEFADPALESRSAGQKILLRVGPANARVLKAKLTELRALVAAGGPAR